jgi:ribose transport system permease protein
MLNWAGRKETKRPVEPASELKAEISLREVALVERQSPQLTRYAAQRLQAGRLLANRDVAVVLVALAIFVAFSLAAPSFLSPGVMIDIARRSAILGVLSVGMTFLFVGGEIDLSIGSHFAFLLIALAKLTEIGRIDPWLASLAIMAIGAVIGAVNGFLVTRIGLPSFIATLGMLILLRGAAQTLSSGWVIPVQNTDVSFYRIIRADVPGTIVPNVFVVMLTCVVIGSAILATTKFGSDVYATGGNREAARNSGIDTQRTLFVCFVGMGALVGFCAALLYGRIGLANLSAGNNLELQVIAAVIIGGTSLFGGRGTVLGGVIGVFILCMITSGIILAGVSQFWDGVGTAVIILFAAGLNVIVQQSSTRLSRQSG